MPEICRFYGIIIYIYYNEHFPPHFHAVYAEYEALVSIDDLAIISGKLPPKAIGLVFEWASLHQKELKRAWTQAMNQQKIKKIEPLK